MPKNTLSKSIRGQVRNFHAAAQDRLQIWTFIVVVTDSNGNELNRIAVEIRSTEIRGIINEGDDVEIFEAWTPPNPLTPSRVYNHTTDSEVRAVDLKVAERKFKNGCVIFLLVVFLIIVIIIVISKSN